MNWLRKLFGRTESNGDVNDCFWLKLQFCDRESGEIDPGWRIEYVSYKRKPEIRTGKSHLKLYAADELVFEGRYKELIDKLKANG